MFIEQQLGNHAINELRAADISKDDGAIKASFLISGDVASWFIKAPTSTKETQASATKFSLFSPNQIRLKQRRGGFKYKRSVAFVTLKVAIKNQRKEICFVTIKPKFGFAWD